MTSTTERDWTEPIGELSMQWATEIRRQFTGPNAVAVTISGYYLGADAKASDEVYGAMIEYDEDRPRDLKTVTILTYVQVCVRPWDGRREVRVQVYSPTGQGTAGVSMAWETEFADGSPELAASLAEIGAWAWEKRLEVAAQV